MTETPWQSYSRAVPERDYVALLSYLPLNSAWQLPRLLLYSTRIRRQLRTSSGLIGYSLRAQLAAKQFWTLSVWEDEAALQAFVTASPHAAVMKALAPHMGATRFARWIVKSSDLSLRWDDAPKRSGPSKASRSSTPTRSSRPPAADAGMAIADCHTCGNRNRRNLHDPPLSAVQIEL